MFFLYVCIGNNVDLVIIYKTVKDRRVGALKVRESRNGRNHCWVWRLTPVIQTDPHFYINV